MSGRTNGKDRADRSWPMARKSQHRAQDPLMTVYNETIPLWAVPEGAHKHTAKCVEEAYVTGLIVMVTHAAAGLPPLRWSSLSR